MDLWGKGSVMRFLFFNIGKCINKEVAAEMREMNPNFPLSFIVESLISLSLSFLICTRGLT